MYACGYYVLIQALCSAHSAQRGDRSAGYGNRLPALTSRRWRMVASCHRSPLLMMLGREEPAYFEAVNCRLHGVLPSRR